MRKLLFVCALVIGTSQAFADFYEDSWLLTKSETGPSKATKADGTSIDVPGEFVLKMNFETSKAYGGENRWIKSQSVQGNVISIEIESSSDLQCGDHAPEISLGMMASDVASATVVVKAGKYQLVINGHVAGSAKVTAQGVGEVRQSEKYVGDVELANTVKLNDVLTPYLSYGLHGEAIKVDLKATTEGIMATYFIAEEKAIDRKTGQMVVKSTELKSSALLKNSYVRSSCSGSFEIEIENDERNVVLKISKNIDWGSVSLNIQNPGYDIPLSPLELN